jgi:hypothetical protein
MARPHESRKPRARRNLRRAAEGCRRSSPGSGPSDVARTSRDVGSTDVPGVVRNAVRGVSSRRDPHQGASRRQARGVGDAPAVAVGPGHRPRKGNDEEREIAAHALACQERRDGIVARAAPAGHVGDPLPHPAQDRLKKREPLPTACDRALSRRSNGWHGGSAWVDVCDARYGRVPWSSVQSVSTSVVFVDWPRVPTSKGFGAGGALDKRRRGRRRCSPPTGRGCWRSFGRRSTEDPVP